MAKFESYQHGQFSWVDLMSRDMSQAKKFYKGLFGWSCEDQDTRGGPPYAIFKRDDELLAGLGQMNDKMKDSHMPSVWSSYINVDEIHETTRQAADHGAKVLMEPFQVFDAGHMAVIQDPTGAHVSFWQRIQHAGASMANLPDTWIWNELITQDLDAAQAFYAAVLDWKFERTETPTGPYVNVTLAERMNAGMMELTPEMKEVPPHWSVYFAVDDLNTTVTRLEPLGGQIIREPFEVPVGMISVVADDQGGVFQLIQRTVPPDA